MSRTKEATKDDAAGKNPETEETKTAAANPEDDQTQSSDANSDELKAQLEAANAELETTKQALATASAELETAKQTLSETDAKLKETGKIAALTIAEQDFKIPEYYSGKVPGHYYSATHPQSNQRLGLRFPVNGDGVSHERVGEVKIGSWLDGQLRAGTVYFKPAKSAKTED